jgi:hypothetical protein
MALCSDLIHADNGIHHGVSMFSLVLTTLTLICAFQFTFVVSVTSIVATMIMNRVRKEPGFRKDALSIGVDTN